MTGFSEWLQLMLGEIARKREELDRAREEEARRAAESRAQTPPSEREPRAARR